jgi:hypothetical protein
MKKIETYNDSLYDHLSACQANVEQLAGVHDLLDTLHFLADLPDKLKAAIAQEKFGEGVAYYKKTRPILDNFSHIASFNAIKVSSEKLVGSIKDTLFSRFDDINVRFFFLSCPCSQYGKNIPNSFCRAVPEK